MNQTNLLFHTFNQFSRHFSKALNDRLVPLGIYAAQWAIVYRLKELGACTQAELCHYLSVEAPTMTRTLSRMENSGWVKRTIGTDRREKKIELTEKALKLYPEWEEAVASLERQVLNQVEEDKKRNALELFEQMKRNIITNAY